MSEDGPLVDLGPPVGNLDLDLFRSSPHGHAAVSWTVVLPDHPKGAFGIHDDGAPGLAGGPALVTFGLVPLVRAPHVEEGSFARRKGLLPFVAVGCAQAVRPTDRLVLEGAGPLTLHRRVVRSFGWRTISPLRSLRRGLRPLRR